MTNRSPKTVLAGCNHLTEAVFVDGVYHVPDLCDECIIDNASQPLTDSQLDDFQQLTVQLHRRAKRDAEENS
jgi:hypothetical protein